ncbi:MAG: translation initiation factor IF-2 associated domain-containing protein, partial [Rhodanobacter sp.]
MSDVTIKQLAQVLGMPVDKLLTQLGEAGMKFSDQEQVISSTEKVKLLGFLRRTHGKGDTAAEADDSAPRQITLKRRTVGELKVATPGARGAAGTAKTVNVEVRAKRTYVKRSVIAEEASAEPEREEAARKLQESQRQREQEENERRELEARRQQEAEQRAQEEEQKQRAEAQRAQAEKEAAEQAAPAAAEPGEATETHDAAATSEADSSVVQRIDQRELGMILPRIHEPRKREKLVKPAPAPAPAPAAPARGAAARPAAGGNDTGAANGDSGRGKAKHSRGERGDASGKRFAGGELH